jgi:protein-disulfide isomerase/uncharacterized membrane protein
LITRKPLILSYRMKSSRFAFVPILLTLLAAVGFGAASYLTRQHQRLTSGQAFQQSACNINEVFNCDQVLTSRFAEVGGIPISSVAAGHFLLLAIVFLASLKSPWRKRALQLVFVQTVIGTGASLVYLGIMVFLVQVYCPFCLVIDTANFLILIVLLASRKSWMSVSGQNWKLKPMAIAYVVVWLISFAASAAFQSFWGPAARRVPIAQIIQKTFASPVEKVGNGRNHPSLGDDHAPVTVTEYVDYACPSCAAYAPVTAALVSKYPGKVRVVIKAYPSDGICNPFVARKLLGFGCMTARAAICAVKFGKFSEIYPVLFREQSTLTERRILRIATRSGIPLDGFLSCIHSRETGALLDEAVRDANALGLKDVPAIYVNGHKLSGKPSLSEWQDILDYLEKPGA